MGNLTGANIRSWVQDQIKTRQTKLALNNRDNDTIVWSNAKTSWLRMISSVNVTPEKSKELTGDENYSGRTLAQNYVLFGGVVSNENTAPILKHGVANTVSADSNPLTNNTYGFNETRGLSPMPGLTSATIKAQNRGALKIAEIKFVAQNKEQFKILDALYMRVGYTILLEYGHTMYFNNEGILQHASYNTKPFEIFRTGESKQKTNSSSGEAGSSDQGTQQVVLKEIDNHRRITNGNYDGFFGKITNFNWSLQTDGTYDITIRAISIGDVIESLNINRPLPPPGGDAISQSTGLSNEALTETLEAQQENRNVRSIIARKDKTKLDRWLYFRYNEVANFDNTERVVTSNITDEVKTKISYKTLKEVNGNTTLSIDRATLAIFPSKGEVKAYMKLGTLLQYINENLLIVDGEGKNYISIDYDFEENTCTTHPFQFSSNPDICIVPFYSPDGSNGKYKFIKKFQYFSKITLNKFRDTESDYVAKLMHIHVNMEYITSLIDKATNEKTGDLYLRGFLANLMGGIQGALGGVNKFTVSYNNEENTLKIYDDVPLDPKATKTNQGPTAEFRAFGVEPGIQGSFVTNVSLNATISSEFATMVSIGAQANATSDITNATALSRLNQGLTDSITPIKRSVSPKPPEEEETPEYKLGETYSKLVENGGLIFEFYFRNSSVTDIIDQATSLNFEFNKFLTTFLTVKKNVPSTQGFIPFDLGLELEGLSGPRIYEKFQISGNILPDSYPKTLAFLIKGLNHTIDQKGWSTTIDSLSYEAPLVDAIPLDEANVESDFSPPPSPPQENPPVVDGEFRTLTSGYLIKNGPNGPFYFSDQTSDKKQITIHYTAGGPNSANSVAWWNTLHAKNGYHISTHYLIGGDGFVEQVFPLKNYANHTGVGGRAKNKYNVGIEMNNYGFGYPERWLASQGRSTLVDRNGNEIESWRGKENYQPLSSGQIQGLRRTLLQIKSAYPKIPLTFNYDACFPGNGISAAAIKGDPGLYTHNSFKPKGQKWDVHPQKELVEMLKTLA